MTTLASAAKAAIVFVIGGVTTETIARQLHLIGGLAVAIGTRGFCMRAGQRKLRFGVIELHALPAFCAVA